MGTRNLTMVINEANETKVAQYGQWDGYPSGQGKTALTFLLGKDNIKNLKEKLNLIRFSTEEDVKEMENFMKDIGSDNGWLNDKQNKKCQDKYPLLTRDNGADILNMLLKIDKKVYLHNESDFANDGLFCEWAYVIDFHKNTFEIYKGFGKELLGKDERFYSSKLSENGYAPVGLVKEYSLNELPTYFEFINDCDKSEEEEEELTPIEELIKKYNEKLTNLKKENMSNELDTILKSRIRDVEEVIRDLNSIDK